MFNAESLTKEFVIVGLDNKYRTARTVYAHSPNCPQQNGNVDSANWRTLVASPQRLQSTSHSRHDEFKQSIDLRDIASDRRGHVSRDF
jgi:hypothetical protein